MAEIRFLGRIDLKEWIEQSYQLGVDRASNESLSKDYEAQISKLVEQRKSAAGMMTFRHLDGEIWRLEHKKSDLSDEWFRNNAKWIAVIDKGLNQLERQQITKAFDIGLAGEPLELIP